MALKGPSRLERRKKWSNALAAASWLSMTSVPTGITAHSAGGTDKRRFISLKNIPRGPFARMAIERSMYSIDYDKEGFRYSGKYFKYAEIKRIRFTPHKTVVRLSNLRSVSVPEPVEQKAQLSLELTDRKPIAIVEADSVEQDNEGRLAAESFLHTAYLKLAKESFPFRFARYKEEFTRTGCLVWNGIRWFGSGFQKGWVRYHYQGFVFVVQGSQLIIRSRNEKKRVFRKSYIILQLTDEQKMVEALLEDVLQLKIERGEAKGENSAEAP